MIYISFEVKCHYLIRVEGFFSEHEKMQREV